jgi:cytochrome c-type biogenesis protein CcmH
MIVLAILMAVFGFALIFVALYPAFRLAPRWQTPVIACAVMAFAVMIYFVGARPGQAGAPYQQQAAIRLATPSTDLTPAERLERVRDMLRQNEDDAASWADLGRMLARSERELEAIGAFQRSIRLELDPQTLSDLGQTFINLNDGQVTPEAVSAFEAAQDMAPDLPEPAFFLGLAAYQAGDINQAEAIWVDILARLDARDPFRVLIAQQAFQLLSQLQVDTTAIDAALSVENFDPQARITQMVERLENRVDGGGATLSDWLRLIRVYGMAVDDDAARNVLDRAREVFSDEAGAMAILNLLAAALATSEGQE